MKPGGSDRAEDWLRVNWVFEADSGELLQVQDFTVGRLVRSSQGSNWGGGGLGDASGWGYPPNGWFIVVNHGEQ